MYQRDFLHKKAIKTKDQHIFYQYKNVRNGVTRSIRRSILKQKFIYTEINKSSGSGKRMWQSLKHFLPSKKKPLLIHQIMILLLIFSIPFLPPLETELPVTLMTTCYQICQLLYMKGKGVSFLRIFLLFSLKAFKLFLIEKGLIY